MIKTFQNWLIEMDACDPAVKWVGDRTQAEAWAQCSRGDWMLWLYHELYPDNHRELTLAKGHCANTVRHLMKDARSTNAVDVAIAYGEGRATEEELEAAAAAAAACTTDYAAAAAYVAAYVANTAVNAATYAAAGAAAVNAATYANTKEQNQQQTADICRKYLAISRGERCSNATLKATQTRSLSGCR